MVENLKVWIRNNFFTKKELVDSGALDSRYYTKTTTGATLTSPIISNPTITGSTGAWAALTLNTAGAWAAFGGNYATPGYKKVGDFVFLRGLVVRSSGIDTTIATLPAGYRPLSYRLMTTEGDSQHARIDVQPDGALVLQNGAATSFLSLDPIWFSVV